MLGATTEFRKMEGIAYDPARNVCFLSMSEVAKGMEDGTARPTRAAATTSASPRTPAARSTS